MALPYELEMLDELISETIHPKKLFDKSTITTSRQCLAWEQTGKLQLANARKRLKPVAYSFLKEKHKRLYIRHHQSAIIHLLDLLFNFLYPIEYTELTEKDSDSKTEKLYKRLFTQCNSFLYYIQDTFTSYWNQDHKIPDSELMQAQQRWKSRIVLIKRKLSRINAEKKLVKLLFAFLEPVFDKTKNISLTYYDLSYINDLLFSLENLKAVTNGNNFCPPLNVLMIYLNLNETNFKDYLADSICADVNKFSSVKEKLDRLFFYHKQISQMHIKPGAALLPRTKSVKDEMKDWLAGEIKYLQKTQSLGIIVPARFRNDTEYKKGIWYNYSVEEIALLHRLQHEARFITNKKVRPMIEDLSKFIHTAAIHNVSAKNLYNSFYSIDLSTIQSLNDKLFTLINQLRKIESQIKRKTKEKQSLRKNNNS